MSLGMKAARSAISLSSGDADGVRTTGHIHLWTALYVLVSRDRSRSIVVWEYKPYTSALRPRRPAHTKVTYERPFVRGQSPKPAGEGKSQQHQYVKYRLSSERMGNRSPIKSHQSHKQG